MPMRLSEFKPGESGTIVSIQGTGALRQRLIAMGVTPGTWLIVRKFAPWAIPWKFVCAITTCPFASVTPP